MLRFSLFGFPVVIHWFFWVNAVLLSGHLDASGPEELQMLLVWVGAALASILIHELGHAFTMRGFGARVSIVLYALGGLAVPDRRFRRGQDILVSLAGPVAQLAAGFAAGALFKLSNGDALWVRHLYADFIFVSIWWALLNLLPIYPLDGGHVLNNLLGPRFYAATMWIGAATAAAVALFQFSRSGSFFPLILFGMLAWQNVQRARGHQPASFLQPG